MSDTEELHNTNMAELKSAEDLQTVQSKLKTVRSSYGGWVTRSLNQADVMLKTPHLSLLIPVRDRLVGHLKKLQSSHDQYVASLTEVEDIDEAEEWMSGYLERATNKILEVEKAICKIQSTPQQVVQQRVEEPIASPSDEVLDEPSASSSASSGALTSESSGASTSSMQSSPAIDRTPTSRVQSSESAAANSPQTPPAVPDSARRSTIPQNESPLTSASSAIPSLVAPSPSVMRSPISSVPSERPIDAWIDDLIPGMETPAPPVNESSNDLTLAVARLELDRDLPKVEIPVFDGSALLWPRFVEQFYIHIHSRVGLSDARRIEILQSHVKGDAKRVIQGLGYSGRNYAQCLQELKFAFGHRVSVARAYVNAITSGSVIASGDSSALRSFYITVRDCITTLRQMCYTSEINSSDVLQRTARRIPNDKRNKWNDFVRNVCRIREPSLLDLQRWLKDCIESEFCPYAVSARPVKQPSQQSSPAPGSHHSTLNTSATNRSVVSTVEHSRRDNERTCLLCSGDHQVARCRQYLNKTVEDRYSFVLANQLCINCLYPGHRIANCTSTVVCKDSGCGKKHHTTLHRRRSVRSESHVNVQVERNVQSSTEVHQVNTLQVSKYSVYFQVVPVVVQGHNGRSVRTYALLDSASDITLINSELADDLGLKGKMQNLVVDTMGPSFSISSKCVSFNVRASEDPEARPLYISRAFTRPGVFNCPSFKMSELQHMPHLMGLNLADVERQEVKLLIGANVPRAHLQLETREGQIDEPIAIQTQLGWCVMGVQHSEFTKHSSHVNLLSASQDELSLQVEQFWQTESFGVRATVNKPRSVEDERALQVLQKDTRFVSGHYEVPMLWKGSDVRMPDNRYMAEKRFQSLTKRFSRDSEFQSQYCEVMNRYISKGYACKLTPEELPHTSKTWYLPHHSVVNPKKPKKVRVVFDAAASLQGISLNSNLISGPDLLNSLFGVIVRFRLKAIALAADVTDMFHQVSVPATDSDALRFLWKEDHRNDKPPDEYKMKVHIFGAKDSPCCANYALRRVALDQEHKGELAIHTIMRNFYVDDMLTSVDDVESAIHLSNRLCELLQDKGFHLTKWMSSSKEVLQAIPQSLRAVPELDLDLSALPTERALGVSWDVEEDCFIFNPALMSVPCTKRGIVKAVSSVFDPLGFIAPFTFSAKCLIQEIWRSGLGWDDTIPQHLQEIWKKWHADLKNLRSLQIPRQYCINSKLKCTELHLFSDASEKGFAAVAYLRVLDDSCPYISFIAAKTHVAPIKHVLTIPKLELQGAVMSVRLANSLKDEFDLIFNRVVFWTDALTVLRYIRNETKRWKIFVANRITEIRESTCSEQWKFVPGVQNPADVATRGMSASDLIIDSVWFRGPEFLTKDEEYWPATPIVDGPAEDDEDLRKPAVINVLQGDSSDGGRHHLCVAQLIDPKRYSSWYKLQRQAAWILRAVKNFLSCCDRFKFIPVKERNLQCSEIKDAEMSLLRMSQREGFTKDYTYLSSGQAIAQDSHLRSLDPFFDPEVGVIRVGGRLKNVPDCIQAQHQILLPYDHHITRLILHAEHQKLAHCGPEQLIASVRQHFWPVKCRLMAKSVIHGCFDCRRRSVLPVVPFMADLPSQRVSGFTRPFTFTGIDYFGPMLVKRGRSRIKRWGCLFTCLVTRAVHLELADSLESDDFILVLRCFIGRRGKPVEIFSDNGTNFVGADRELQDCLNELDPEKVNEFLLQSSIKWNFIPPHAPHFGGAWERLVRSVKRSLKAVLKEHLVCESVLRTVLIEVEDVINNRPLTHNSSDPNDYSALTPNHFLRGESSASPPHGQFEIDSRKRWRQSQILADHVWHRWLKEYLPGLNVRHKWTADQRNHVVGDLILLVDDNRPRGQWLLGRVEEVFVSEDNRVRTVRVKTSTGSYVRPVSKLCLLEESSIVS